jgi:hypothetical protein
MEIEPIPRIKKSPNIVNIIEDLNTFWVFHILTDHGNCLEKNQCDGIINNTLAKDNREKFRLLLVFNNRNGCNNIRRAK